MPIAAPGKIILTRRMVSFCLNDDEMALIVGHEMAHQVLGHLIRGAAHRELGKFVGEAITAVSTLSLNHLLDWRHVMVSPERSPGSPKCRGERFFPGG